MKYFLSLLLLLSTIFANADAPLQAPKVIRRENLNKTFTAVSDPKKGTVILRTDGKEMWRIPAWFRDFYIANDGVYFVSTYWGMDLIPLDYKTNLVLMTFWKNGKIIKEVPIKELVTSKDVLVRTASHYLWGTVEGLNKDDLLTVRRADGVIFLYNIKTGNQIKH
ncbi:hypothetical protein ACO0K9_04355 [Undibacterium sp. Ji50W]|uniref:hypothetical protein n=1 Tax=Undibacterium sp. Ji50W TaxID=3413041 RepID=UPI003BF32DE7